TGTKLMFTFSPVCRPTPFRVTFLTMVRCLLLVLLTVNLFFYFGDLIYDFGQVFEKDIGFVEVPVVQGRGSLYHFIILEVLSDPRLRLDLDPVPDGDVPHNAHLAPDQTVFS